MRMAAVEVMAAAAMAVEKGLERVVAMVEAMAASERKEAAAMTVERV